MTEPADPLTTGAADERAQLESFLEHYRIRCESTLDELSEEEASRHLVPSQTTLLGLLKHLTFMQTVWTVEAVTGTPRSELGLPQSAESSFELTAEDTIDVVLDAFRRANEVARSQLAGRSLDDVVTGHRIGPISVRWIHLQCLREFAHHCGHADILREQILAARSADGC